MNPFFLRTLDSLNLYLIDFDLGILLVKKRELLKLIKNKGREGMTLVPLKLYFNEVGIAKILIGIGKGKKNVDKRETEKKRDWNIQKGRLLRNKH